MPALAAIWALPWVKKAVGIAVLILAAFTGIEIWKARLRAAGAKAERDRYAKESERIREGMIRAPQHNEEGTANELDQGKY